MDQVTQQNAALVEEAAAAAESLLDQAGHLSQVVGVFQMDSTQTAATSAPAGTALRATPRSQLATPARAMLPASKPARTATATAAAGVDDWEQF